MPCLHLTTSTESQTTSTITAPGSMAASLWPACASLLPLSVRSLPLPELPPGKARPLMEMLFEQLLFEPLVFLIHAVHLCRYFLHLLEVRNHGLIKCLLNVCLCRLRCGCWRLLAILLCFCQPGEFRSQIR